MSVSVIIVENSERYRRIIKTFLEQNGICILGSYSHTEFIDQKPLLTFDVALISFRTKISWTAYTIEFLRNYYRYSKIALLVSAYDSANPQELETLAVDGAIRKAADDPNELLIMLDAVMGGEKYVTLTIN